jgi:hypothetical protein
VHWNGLPSNPTSPAHNGSLHRKEFVNNKQLRLKVQQLRVRAGHSQKCRSKAPFVLGYIYRSYPLAHGHLISMYSQVLRSVSTVD